MTTQALGIATRAEVALWRRRGRHDPCPADVEALAARLLAKHDAQDEGETACGLKAGDRGAYSRCRQAFARAELTRQLAADIDASRFSDGRDEPAIRAVGRFDGKPVLRANIGAFAAEQGVERYQGLAGIAHRCRVLERHLEIAPVFLCLPDPIRAHALTGFLALVLSQVMRLRSARPRVTAPAQTPCRKSCAACRPIGFRSVPGA